MRRSLACTVPAIMLMCVAPDPCRNTNPIDVALKYKTPNMHVCQQ